MNTRSLGSKRTDVLARVRHNFPKWDHNSDGKIDHKELRRNTADAEIQGRDAAALASLVTLQKAQEKKRNLKTTPAFREQDLVQLEQDYFSTEKKHRADVLFEHFVKKLDNSPTDLFATGLPNAMHLRQGATPTCAFLAPLFALTHRDPEKVASMMTTLDDGRISVKFATQDPIVVDAPTDTECAIYSSSKDGTWLTAIEKAWSVKLERNHHPRRQDSRPYEDNATSPVYAMLSLTGKMPEVKVMPKTSKVLKKGKTPRFFTKIADALAKDAIVCASIHTGENHLEGLADWHAYTVESWDEKESLVGLRNPWGSGEPVNVSKKARDGRDEGRFQVTMEEFLQNFRDVTIEG